MLKTCFRCGIEFEAPNAERVCVGCRKPHVKEPLPLHLTPREKQIASLVRQAKLNKEIAYELHLSEGTIKEYLNKVYRKLRADGRIGLVVMMFEHPELFGERPCA